MSGWFAIKHGIRKHPIFDGRPERLGAWIAILDEAAWADTRQNVGGEIVDIMRGELCASQAMLEQITGLTRKQLRTFLDVLKSEGAIRTRPATKGAKSRAIITICNYSKYQTSGPSDGQAGAKQGPTKEQDNNIPVGTGEKSPAEILFQNCVHFLAQSGTKEAHARSFIGKLRKDHTDEAIILAFGRAQKEGALDPKEFITGALRFQAKRKEPQYGDTITKDGITKVFRGSDGWIRQWN